MFLLVIFLVFYEPTSRIFTTVCCVLHACKIPEKKIYIINDDIRRKHPEVVSPQRFRVRDRHDYYYSSRHVGVVIINSYYDNMPIVML